MQASKFDRQRAETITASVKGGAGRRDSARAAGIAPSTLQEWIRRGRAGDAAFVAFAEAIDGADASAVVVAESKLYTLGVVNGDARALTTWLRAKRPKKYGEQKAGNATPTKANSEHELAMELARARCLQRDPSRGYPAEPAECDRALFHTGPCVYVPVAASSPLRFTNSHDAQSS